MAEASISWCIYAMAANVVRHPAQPPGCSCRQAGGSGAAAMIRRQQGAICISAGRALFQLLSLRSTQSSLPPGPASLVFVSGHSIVAPAPPAAVVASSP